MASIQELGRPLFGHRVFRQGVQLVFWRVVQMSVALAGTIWASRCLGPEKLGISGLVISIATSLALVIGLQMNAEFVRYFKLVANEAERTRYIDMLVSFRFFQQERA